MSGHSKRINDLLILTLEILLNGAGGSQSHSDKESIADIKPGDKKSFD